MTDGQRRGGVNEPKTRAKPKKTTLICGDTEKVLKRVEDESCALIVSSPPYNIGKRYERDDRRSLEEYRDWQARIANQLVAKLRDDGSLCWQVGSFIDEGELMPLDHLFVEMFRPLGLKLRNRIIWRYNFGRHASRKFSGRYETLLWLTKSDNYKFSLDPVRVPQIYPGKRHGSKKGDRAGQPSGNPLGKNPSDFWEFSAERDFILNPVWDIPNVKNNHPEKTEHPCQFPVELVERCILAMTQPGDCVLDPFVGTGASLIAANLHNRRSIGIDREKRYIEIARGRLKLLELGELRIRPSGTPIRRPSPTERVSRVPVEWTTPGSLDGVAS